KRLLSSAWHAVDRLPWERLPAEGYSAVRAELSGHYGAPRPWSATGSPGQPPPELAEAEPPANEAELDRCSTRVLRSVRSSTRPSRHGFANPVDSDVTDCFSWRV
ncbi:hypothetical protein, partial [Streptomyces sp. NPDC058011]|uniref:hypothetical protein n=1 Tax=Streptomyces sp. NPDC058011 TaxID=3346305 RepID=UPI0036E1EC56